MADDGLTHFDEAGRPRMVDVTGKDVTARVAVAEGRLAMAADTLERILSGRTPKGNPLHIAEVAGIMGGKRTAELIPLCHQLPGASIEVSVDPDPGLPGVVVRAEARIAGQTGVEMEALTAVSVALLALYDMVKGIDRGMRIDGIRLLRKEGGRSGAWTAG
jgi:cyclic pyranopterin phosphate synthase